jgi:hypothetical protein
MTETKRSKLKRARMFAEHICLIVRGGKKGAPFTLSERYAFTPARAALQPWLPHYNKRLIGTYRSVETLERGLSRYLDREYARQHKLERAEKAARRAKRQRRAKP